jgi:cytidylate kinase
MTNQSSENISITLGGLGGTGTSTVAKELGSRLSIPVFSIGDIMRANARDMGMTIEEFAQHCVSHPDVDRQTDKNQANLLPGESKVVDSRMGFFFVKNAFKILLVCDQKVRVARMAVRDSLSLEEAELKDRERVRLDKDRYYYAYGLEDYIAPLHYDLIIDTSTHDTSQIVNTAINGFEKFCKQK